MILRGPSDADHFRVEVGRYGDRWYTDPLAADERWTASEATWPSVSTVKKASGDDWSFVALKRVADELDARPDRLTGLDHAGRYETLKAINKLGLDAAARRGTNVHTIAEALLRGETPTLPIGAPGIEYRAAVVEFFDTYQPELVGAEFVCMHRDLNGVGYGGTCDAAVRIEGKTYIVDWKSRGAESSHGAYPAEAAQIAAYARADYMIVEGEHGPERRALPDFDGGLIVSIKPDGARVYPIDLDAAFEHWMALHAWWCARRSERSAIGRQWAPRKVPAPAAAVEQVTPTSAREGDSPAPTRAEVLVQLGTSPDEGRTDGGVARFNALRSRYDLACDDEAVHAWLTILQHDAKAAGVGFHLLGHHTQRRYHIVSGLVTLAERSADSDDTVRSIVASIIGDVAFFAGVTTGAVLGSLGAAEARTFSARCDQLTTTTVNGVIGEDGRTRLHFAA